VADLSLVACTQKQNKTKQKKPDERFPTVLMHFEIRHTRCWPGVSNHCHHSLRALMCQAASVLGASTWNIPFDTRRRHCNYACFADDEFMGDLSKDTQQPDSRV
jgi:hypothetical protein